jgi:hypothetical protein
MSPDSGPANAVTLVEERFVSRTVGKTPQEDNWQWLQRLLHPGQRTLAVGIDPVNRGEFVPELTNSRLQFIPLPVDKLVRAVPW